MARLRKYLCLILLLIFSVLGTALVYRNPFSEIEQYAEDFVYDRASNVPDNVKIIGIDEKSLAALGPYSDWDRAIFADLIETLYSDSNSSPRVLAFDVMFTGENNSEADARLAEVAGRYDNIICASKLEVASRIIKRSGEVYRETYISSEVGAYDALSANIVSGFVTPIFDEDGYTRRAYSTLNYDGVEHVSFALQVARMAGYEGNIYGVYEFEYSGNPGDFEVIPLTKVLDGTVKPSYFDDCIVLVGAYEEGLMDSYSVPIDHSQSMYGVEIQANQIVALMHNKIISKATMLLAVSVTLLMTLAAGLIIISTEDVRIDFLATVLACAVYMGLCAVSKSMFKLEFPVVYYPITIILMFVADLVIEYVMSQRLRIGEMHRVLYSMADSMAEAIEGRTPYNANHTKNVAKRSVEMVDYINELHRKKHTRLHFSANDREQLYLAAMLHDIGKMDVPTDIMDKPSRLGDKREAFEDRLKLIKLHLRVDELDGSKPAAVTAKETADIDEFLSKLEAFDSGKPLSDEEFAYIDEFASRTYTNGEVTIPYVDEDELDDLHIKAGTLSDHERKRMQSHVVYTDKILSHIDFGKEFDRVRQMAADHHELINGQGYPYGKTAEELDPLTRILTIMDIYDSLIADDRPYKKAKSIPVAFKILDEEAQMGKIDKELLEIAKALYLKEEE